MITIFFAVLIGVVLGITIGCIAIAAESKIRSSNSRGLDCTCSSKEPAQ
jgi:hypothetical protein